MAKEIERKFLVRGDGWKTGNGVLFRQGYLSKQKERTVRVRREGDCAVLTIKGSTIGVTRSEFEYPIPVSDAEELLDICEKPLIEKVRHLVEHFGKTWEVDEFLGENEGLIVAEIELGSETEEFESPAWLGEEVSDDPRYFNANLVQDPFQDWK